MGSEMCIRDRCYKMLNPYLQNIFELTNLSSLIVLKLIMSLIYLIVNYITHQIKLPVMLANILRLMISALDSVVLFVLLFRYVWELCEMAIAFS